MSYSTIILEKENNVATITLNRPDKLNAFNNLMSAEMDSAMSDLARDREAMVIIITGTGRGFCTGGDVEDMAKPDQPRSAAPMQVMPSMIAGTGGMAAAVLKIRFIDKPVIAAINGVTAGGGFGIALSCDIRIASDQSKFVEVFVRRCLSPAMGSTYALPRLMGIAKALELTLTGGSIDAREAERLGIVNRVVPHNDLMKAAKEMAGKMAQYSPLALSAIKQVIYKGAAEPNFATQLEYEVERQRFLESTEDFKEGVKSFLEKRPPKFRGV